MLGRTPPSAMVVLWSNLLSSSSFLMASRMCLGTILVFLLSLAALPANSRTSAARYSRTAARQTGAPAPTRSVQWACLRRRPTLPTGNWRPALLDLETALEEVVLALPDFPPLPAIVLYFEQGLGSKSNLSCYRSAPSYFSQSIQLQSWRICANFEFFESGQQDGRNSVWAAGNGGSRMQLFGVKANKEREKIQNLQFLIVND